MPLPTPRDNESKEDFISRCMGDKKTADEFPDQSQRRAVCESQWKKGTSSEAMKYPHVYNAIMDSHWAILPAKLSEIATFIESKAFNSEEFISQFPRPTVHSRRESPYTVQNGVAIIPLFGSIMPRMGSIMEFSGGTSVQQFQLAFAEALDDNSVHSILIECDSPGGMVNGVPELASHIYNARGTKPIVATANTLMASAAYWIAAQADEVVATPSAMVGSIGVIAMHRDESKLWDRAGVKTTFITAGQYKSEGNRYEPLNKEAKNHIQTQINDVYREFVESIARARGTTSSDVESQYGQGRVFRAYPALESGLINRIETLDETIARLATGDQVDNTGNGARSYILTSPVEITKISSDVEDNERTSPVSSIESAGSNNGGTTMPDAKDHVEDRNVNSLSTDASAEELQQQLEATRAELAEARSQIESAEAEASEKDAVIESLSGRVGGLESENRRKRFTDIVLGRAEGNDGQRWFGDVEKHVALMESFASQFGEQSEELQSYIEIQSQQAKMIHESSAFESSGHDAPVPMHDNAIDEFNAKISDVQKQAAENGTSLEYAEAVEKAARENPDLYKRYSRASRVKV